jgi:hypothetical protein
LCENVRGQRTNEQRGQIDTKGCGTQEVELLKRTSCCCGATKSNPCACMKKGIMKCSAKEPKCPCYKAKDIKKAFDGGWNTVVKMNPRLPKEGAIDGVLARNPDPPTMNAGMPRDPNLLARLKRMYGDNPMKKPKKEG